MKDKLTGLDFLDNYSCLQGAVSFLSFCAASSEMTSGRRKADFLADRLAVASNESTLFRCLAQFRKSLNVGPGQDEVLFGISKSKFSTSVLRLIREYPVEVTALIFTKKGEKAQRYLPEDDGLRECRLMPPYWNLHDTVRCCDIGDIYEI